MTPTLEQQAEELAFRIGNSVMLRHGEKGPYATISQEALVPFLMASLRTAYRAGEENMREYAAKEIEPTDDPKEWNAYQAEAAMCAKLIRSLPLSDKEG